MTLQEMYNYTEQQIQKQGSASSKVLAPLFKSMLEYMGENNDGLIETNPVTIESQASETGDNFSIYKVNNAQSEIDSIIELVNNNSQKARVIALDNGLTILFPFTEFTNESITAIAPAHDGYYYLHLDSQADGSYLTHYAFTEAIAPVTEGEIEVYKKLFNADYDKATNKFSVLVGSTVYNLSPADMIMADQEYDKVANTVNYTAMWANSKAKYIKCHEWFSGFSTDIDLHSAFFGAAAEAIDLNVDEELVVSNLTNAFANCSELQEITGILKVPGTGYSVFGLFNKCIKLHSVKIKNLGLDISFIHSPYISAESILYIVENAKADTAFTLTLNPTTLEKYNNSQDWVAVKSAVESNGKITIA